MAAFPNGKYSDQVDSMAQALLILDAVPYASPKRWHQPLFISRQMMPAS